MLIAIPTCGRAFNQVTYQNFPPEIRSQILLVVQKREEHLYTHRFQNLLVLPDHIQTLSPARQEILEYCAGNGVEKVFMLDDDLIFCKKKVDDPTKLLPCSPSDIQDMVSYVDKLLDEYVHVSLGPRLFANTQLKDYRENFRAMRALAYRPKVVLESGCKFDRLTTKTDFDLTLQLLGKGYKNAVIYKYVNDQKGSNTAGGCSAYRTEDMMKEDSEKLAEFHPGIVTVVKKKTKGGWGGMAQERTDVRISWKKAYKEKS